MPTPGEHKTVQPRILGYAEAIGWTFVSREEAEQRRGFEPQMGADAEPGQKHLRKSASSAVKQLSNGEGLSLFFDDLLDAKVREFNPRYAEAEGALLGQFRHLHADI
jgi:type I restriction enzyme R subunit